MSSTRSRHAQAAHHSAHHKDLVGDDPDPPPSFAFENQQALAEAYDRFSSLVYSLAFRIVGDEACAEDILQEVFLRLWRGTEVYDQSHGSFYVWITFITRQIAFDEMRRRTLVGQSPTNVTPLARIAKDEPSRLSTAEGQPVASVLDSLAADQRETLELVYFGGLTCAGIAARTGEPLKAIASRVRLALDALRRLRHQAAE